MGGKEAIPTVKATVVANDDNKADLREIGSALGVLLTAIKLVLVEPVA
jgi:hypothetical protein